MKNTKLQFIVIGAMDGVSSGALCSALEASGHTVIYAINQFFVWMTAGAMDLEDQWKLAKIIERYNSNDLYVILGCPDAESSQIQAETVTIGDPSLSGPLTGKQLRLNVVHVVEEKAIKFFSAIPYNNYIAPFISKINAESICQRMEELRRNKLIK